MKNKKKENYILQWLIRFKQVIKKLKEIKKEQTNRCRLRTKKEFVRNKIKIQVQV